MNKNKVTALALAIALAFTPLSVSASNAKDECAIDKNLKAMLKAVNANEEKLIEKSVEKPVKDVIRNVDVKKGGCLPALDAFDALMRMRIPSIGSMMGGFFNMIKKMACEFANDFIEQEINGFDLSIGDPYGVINVGIGGTTNGDGGLVTDEYDIGKMASDAAVDAVTGAVKDAVGGVTGGKSFSSGISGPQDRIPRIEDTINDGVRDAFKGL